MRLNNHLGVMQREALPEAHPEITDSAETVYFVDACEALLESVGTTINEHHEYSFEPAPPKPITKETLKDIFMEVTLQGKDKEERDKLHCQLLASVEGMLPKGTPTKLDNVYHKDYEALYKHAKGLLI